ncbi:DUF397 domain-containing protein [Actinomadura viridis]|uniref:DUF397 domain-containing protein n=1 Tax=Actinomadura viridis TaxID=58110 RepID=A0A931GMM6_9ACTN|nr:DUF397 domain-containing protein [Actinomadura viridis]MBG6092150.1 hypothetical protein [Actinomadura viridis]
MSDSLWRKAGRSNTQGNECVEVAALGQVIGVRDSKAPEAGHLSLPRESFAALLARLKDDETG